MCSTRYIEKYEKIKMVVTDVAYTELGDGGFSLYSLSRLLEGSGPVCVGRLLGAACFEVNDEDAAEVMEITSKESSLFFPLFLIDLVEDSLIE